MAFILDRTAARKWLNDVKSDPDYAELADMGSNWSIADPNASVWASILVLAAQDKGFFYEQSGAKFTMQAEPHRSYSFGIEVPYGDQNQVFTLKTPGAPYTQTFIEDFSTDLVLGAYGNPDPRGIDAQMHVLERARDILNRVLGNFETWAEGRFC